MSASVDLGALFADAMAQVDGCSCGNTQPPNAAIPRPGGQWLLHYVCSDCEHAWEVTR